MLKLRFKETRLLTDLNVSKEYIVKPKKLNEKDKIPITVDEMFRTMFQNQKRIKYSCKLISYYIIITYEKLLKKLKFTKNQPGKDNNDDINQRCDYIASIDDTNICIEMNNNSTPEIMERNIDYIVKQYSENSTIINGKYKFNQVILFNLNNFSYEGNDDIEEYFTLNNGNLMLTDKIIIINIYIPNILKKLYNEGEESLSEREKYIVGLVLQDSDEALELGKEIDIMEEYVTEARQVSHHEGLRESYDKQLALLEETKQDGYNEAIKLTEKEIEKLQKTMKLSQKQLETLEESKRDGYNEGYNKGIEEAIENLRKTMSITQKHKVTLEEAKRDGYNEGYQKTMKLTQKQKETLEEAKRDGYNEGYEEAIANKNIDIAKKLLSENIDINIICKVTGLTKDVIENL